MNYSSLLNRMTKAGALSLAIAAATPASAAAGLTFVVDGDTFDTPYSITNTSTAGERIIGFGVTLLPPYGFDTAAGGFGIDAANAFAPQGGTELTTFYTGSGAFADGATSLNFSFLDFDAGESFVWQIDVDQPGTATVIANELIGSDVYAFFSDGYSEFGTFVAFGATGAEFVINAVPEPATWALMMLGFGAIGGTLRRRRPDSATA